MPKRDPETDPRAYLAKKQRRARVAAGFSSQDALAAALGFDRSVVTKAESGDRVPSVEVLAAWCAACGMDEELFQGLAVVARGADGPVPTWFEGWLDAEGAAHALRIWSPLLIPGLLQTPQYARALFEVAFDDEEKISAQVTARMERQPILDQPDPPQVAAVVYELVLHHLVGSPAIMAEQLEHVADMAERLNMSVHVLPSAGANVGLSGAFDLASVDGRADTLRMSGVEDQTTENRDLIRKSSINFDLIRRDALPRVPSRTLFLEAADKWKQQ
jgi:transcriptional regulator with XRE-family HTH domain